VKPEGTWCEARHQ